MTGKPLMIKVCGMRDAANIKEVEALGIDMMGLIFYPKSPRYVEKKPEYLPENCTRIGVFVNAQPDDIERIAFDYSLNAVQLHGTEPPEYCSSLRHRLGDKVKIIKALSIKDNDSINQAKCYNGAVDMLLFDTPCCGYGGSGQTFDWTLLDSYDGTTPFMLSGGIGRDSAQSIRKLKHPRLAGIDLNSRFETSPGFKDVEALRTFINSIRS